MQELQHNPLREQVLGAIKSGGTKMKPKWHFILRTALFLSGCLLVFLLLVYLVSLGLFVLDEHQLWVVPSFGFRGIFLFLFSLPWLLIALVLIFLALLQLLVRHYSFAYSRPLFYSALGVLGIVIVGSIVVRQVGFHKNVFEYSTRHHLPLAEPFYQRVEFQENSHVYRGTISQMQEKVFFLKSRSEDVFEVHITPLTRFPRGVDFVVGDEVIVVGDRNDNTIEAYGVRKIQLRGGHLPGRMNPPPPQYSR